MLKSTLFLIIPFLALNFFDTDQKIEWQVPTTHDFGSIKKDIPVEHIFTFKNISGTPLTVDNVRTSCGCTAPEWDETEVILPDSTGTVKLIFNARASGYFYKMAKVFFNGQKKGEKLYIEGDVIP